MIVLTPVHVLSLVATLFVILAITVWSARSVTSTEGFSLCGRSSGTILVAGTIAGTCVGGPSTIGTTQLAFSVGLSAWWFTLGIGLGLILMACLYAAPLRRAGLETVPEYLSIHYGRLAGPLTGVISSLGILFSQVASMLSGIALVGLLCGLTAWQAGIAIFLLVIPCVFFGGLKGAAVSGLLKMAVLWLTLLAVGVLACVSLARLPDFTSTFPAFPWFSLIGTGGVDGAGNVASLIIGMICTQTYIQAVYSATNARAAVRGALIAAALGIPVGLPCIAVGMFMHATHPDIQPIMALPMYLTLYVPAWLGGIALGGILFSVVGSIAGLALGIGTMMARDIAGGLLGVTEGRWILLINRLTVVVVTCLAMVIALTNADTLVFDWNYLSMAFRAGGVFIPLTLAIFLPRRLPGGWAVLSMAVSTASAVIGHFAFRLAINPLFIGLSVSLLMVCLGMMVSSLPGRRPAGQSRLA
jgi:SSS family solute:Na+ symporter